MSKADRKLEVVLEGSAASGRISVDYLATLATELQTTLRRIAKNRAGGPGRPGKEIEQACRLDLVSFAPGSVHLGFELADAPSETLFGELGEDSMNRLVLALERGEANAEAWSSDLPPPAIDGLDRLTKPLDDGITAIRFKTFGAHRRSVAVTKRFREQLRKTIRAHPNAGSCRITGVIWEADWKDHSAELHEPDGNMVKLIFDSDRDEEITQARKRNVIVTGSGTRVDGHLKRLQLEHIEIVDATPLEAPANVPGFWENLTVQELAERQQVAPIHSLDDLAGDWPADDSIDDFLATVRNLRA